MVRGCALIDSRLDTAKICSDGRVHVDHAELPVVLGEKKRFYTVWVKNGSRGFAAGCKQLLESDTERQILISSWMRGYFSATKNLSSSQPDRNSRGER